MESDNVLVGTWKLVSFELCLQDGTAQYPWGKEVVGQVMYGADGYMAGSFMRKDRIPFAALDVMAGTSQEFAAAMKSYVGYAGTYSLHDNRVIHHVAVSLFPNWTGTDIERYFEINGNQLTLSTPPLVVGGILGSAVLVWEKQLSQL